MKKNIKLPIMIYLLVIIALNFSCTQGTTSNSKTKSQELSKENNQILASETTNRLKYTSGIRSILQDSKGNYWFGSHQEGVCLYDGQTFTYFTVKEGLSGNQIRTIQEDEHGVIWFGTGNGVSNYKDGVIKNQTSSTSYTGLKSYVQGGWAVTENDLWFDAGKESAVYRYDQQKLSYLELPVQGETKTMNVFTATDFSKGKDNHLWIATFAAVIGYDGQSFEIIDDKALGYSKEVGLLHVRSILEDSKGNVWIGNNGIGVLRKQGESITNFSKQMGLTNSTTFGRGDHSPQGTLEHVFVIKEDKDGNIWFGDRDNGAWKFDGKTMTNYNIDNQLKSKMIGDIYEDKNNHLLFGVMGGGVYQFDGESFERKF